MCVHPTCIGFCSDCFLPNAAWTCIDEEFDSAPSSAPFAFSDRSLTDCRRNRISRLRCPAIEKQNRLAVLDRSLAVCPSVWLWPRGAGRHVIGKCWIIFSSNCWGCDVRVVGSEVAEPLGASGPAHLYELVVGVVFHSKKCDWGLVFIHGPDQHYLVRYPFDALRQARKNICGESAFLERSFSVWSIGEKSPYHSLTCGIGPDSQWV